MIATLGLAFGVCCLTLGFAVGLVVGTREMRDLGSDRTKERLMARPIGRPVMDDATRDQLFRQIERTREEMVNLHADQLDARMRVQRLELAGLDLERRLATLEAKLVRLEQRLDQGCEQFLEGREAALSHGSDQLA